MYEKNIDQKVSLCQQKCDIFFSKYVVKNLTNDKIEKLELNFDNNIN